MAELKKIFLEIIKAYFSKGERLITLKNFLADARFYFAHATSTSPVGFRYKHREGRLDGEAQYILVYRPDGRKGVSWYPRYRGFEIKNKQNRGFWEL